jgi:hypothetical protein
MDSFGWIYKLTRWVLGGVFVAAGGLKLMEPQTFAVLIEAYGIVPESLLMPTAMLLPALEVAAGVGLLFDIRGSLSVVTGLLLVFIAILAYGIWMGLDVDCGCFGLEDPEADAFHGLRQALYRDVVLLAGVAFLFGWRRYRAVEPVRLLQIINDRLKQRRLDNVQG